MYLPEFAYHRPRSLDEALDLKAADEGAVWYVGGTEIVALMKVGLASPSALIDLKGITALRNLTAGPDGVTIGAAVTHRTLEHDAGIAAHLPVLSRVAHTLANVRVRNVGSLGGNLCFAEPHSDPAPLLVALDARVQLRSTRGEREVELSDFLVGPFETDLAADEVMTAIHVPRPDRVAAAALGRRAFRERPTVNVVVLELDDGFRVTTGAAGPIPVRARDAEALLDERRGDPEGLREVARAAGEAAAEVAGAYDESGASAEYKQQLVAVLVDRAVQELAPRPS